MVRGAGCSLAEARDRVKVALPEADLALVGAPGPRQAPVEGSEVPPAGLRLWPGASHATHAQSGI